MSTKFKHLLFLTFLVVSLKSYSQNTCSLESYYACAEIFSVDSVYEKVNIDGKNFTIKVLYDKKNEYFEEVGELDEYAFSSDSPITLVFYNYDDQKIVYAKKFGYELPRFFKASDDLSGAGKLYLSWFSSGGGSGYSSDKYLVNIQDEHITLEGVLSGNELSFELYNKNDNEIYFLQGIWGFSEDTDSEEFETHFSDHQYEISVYRYDSDGFEVESKILTKNKYSSEWEDPKELLREIIRKEHFKIDINHFY